MTRILVLGLPAVLAQLQAAGFKVTDQVVECPIPEPPCPADFNRALMTSEEPDHPQLPQQLLRRSKRPR